MRAWHPISAFTLGAAVPSGLDPTDYKCAKSVILPPDFMKTTTAAPLPSAAAPAGAPSAKTSALPWVAGVIFAGLVIVATTKA